MILLIFAGNRNWNDGTMNNQGTNANYWSTTPNTTNAYNLNFNASNINPANNNNRGNEFSLRCIKNYSV